MGRTGVRSCATILCMATVAAAEFYADTASALEAAVDARLSENIDNWTAAALGEGVIELRQLRQAVDKTGYEGPIEVEIFNEDVWKSADDQLLERIQRCFVKYV